MQDCVLNFGLGLCDLYGRHVAHIDEGVERSMQDVVRKLEKRGRKASPDRSQSGSPTQHASAGGGFGLDALEDAGDARVLREHLRVLKELHSEGLISDTVYERKQLSAVSKTRGLNNDN